MLYNVSVLMCNAFKCAAVKYTAVNCSAKKYIKIKYTAVKKVYYDTIVE